VGIFRRGRNTDEDAEVEQTPDQEVETADEADAVTEPRAGDADAPGVDVGDEETRASTARTGDVASGRREQTGPFDVSEVEDDEGLLDLGALRIRGVPGMELRLEVDENAGQVVGATAVIGDSAVQLQAFAAPKTMGIWDDIRSEIAESILSQGGTADEARGPLGFELRTRMPSAGPDGRTVFAPARFAGIDGPRWFLRAVFSGRAAIDDEAAAPLLEVVRKTVVVRGDAAMAPREMLVLKLPEQVGEQAQEAGEDDTRRADDLKPFERGPEITEVR
jgi:hypothetical protein